jgi:hypothetical protein
MRSLAVVAFFTVAIALTGPLVVLAGDEPASEGPAITSAEEEPPSAASAGASVDEEPASEGPVELGVLDPVEASFDVEVPRDRLWRAPHGRLVLPESVVVRDVEGQRLACVESSPTQGQYRPRLDGCIRFSRDDVGRKVHVTYEYRPLRVGLLPPLVATDYEDAYPTMLEVLTQEAERRGFVLADPDEVADGIVELKITHPSQYPKLAKQLNVASLVLAGIAASADEVFAGFQSHTSGSGSGSVNVHGTVSSSPYSGSGTVQGTGSSHVRMHSTTSTSAVYKDMMLVTVGLQVYDGASGELIGEVYRADSKRVRFRRFGPTRRSLTRHLTEKAVSALLDPPV